MAESRNSIVSIVGILAIAILVGLAVYFVLRTEDQDELEIEVPGSMELLDGERHLAGGPPPAGLTFVG